MGRRFELVVQFSEFYGQFGACPEDIRQIRRTEDFVDGLVTPTDENLEDGRTSSGDRQAILEVLR